MKINLPDILFIFEDSIDSELIKQPFYQSNTIIIA